MKAGSHNAMAAAAALMLICVLGGPLGAAVAAAPAGARIVLLHHSTGECVWNGGVAGWFEAYNAAGKTDYRIGEQNFPKDSPYGWENYPYDYWNIWVRHAGAKPYKNEPTLEILTGKYDVIVLKHCFPVSNVEPDTGRPDVASSDKRIENYKLQYEALKKKMRQFPRVRFIVWTGAALTRPETSPAAATRAKAFFDWVRGQWDRKGDNIYLWDFRRLETDGGLYLKQGYAQAAGDSHPNETFSRKVAPMLCQRIVDVIGGRGDTASITGEGGKPLAAAPARAVAPPAPEPRVAATTAPATRPASAPAVKLPPAGPGKWVFDDAETDAPAKKRWGKGAGYARDGRSRAVKIDFAAGEQEDWGEYGKHRIVRTRPPARNYDVSPYRYLALRVKADRQMEVVLTLVTLPKPGGNVHQPHFAFSCYVRPKAGQWAWLVFDLTKLELAVEGPEVYEKAGKPTRPMQLTGLKLCTNVKHEKAAFLLDDITFLRDMPEALKPYLQAP